MLLSAPPTNFQMQGISGHEFMTRGMSVSTYDQHIHSTIVKVENDRSVLEMSAHQDAQMDDIDSDDDDDDQGDIQGGDNSLAAKKKRRRSRKGLVKKFACPEAGCGKTYSRAEHLYRHQLNHDPKEIFHCGFPDCNRYFVRQDLCLRHRERHGSTGSSNGGGSTTPTPSGPTSGGSRPSISTTSGTTGSSTSSQIVRRDGIEGPRKSPTAYQANDLASPRTMSPGTMSRDSNSATPTMKQQHDARFKMRRNTADANMRIKNEQRPPVPSNSPHSLAKRKYSVDTVNLKGEPSPRYSMEHHHQQQQQQHLHHHHQQQHHMYHHHSSTPPYNRPTVQTALPTPNMVGLSLTSPYTSQPTSAGLPYGPHQQQQPPHPHQQQRTHTQFRRSPSTASASSASTPHQQPLPHPHPPHPQHQTSQPQLQHQQQHLHPQEHHQHPQEHPEHEHQPHDQHHQYSQQYQYSQTQAFTTQAQQTPFITSPPTSSTSVEPGTSGPTPATSLDFIDPMSQYTMPVFGGESYNRSPFTITDDFTVWLFEDQALGLPPNARAAAAFMENASAMNGGVYFGGEFPQGMVPNPAFHHPMALTSIMAPPSPPQETLLSEHKRQELVDIIESYPDASLSFGRNSRAASLKDLRMEDERVLSLPMMQMYVQLYWQHFHPQLPILHKPTFVADKTPNLLMLAIIAVGAVCVDRKEDDGIAHPTSELASLASELASLLVLNLRWQLFDHSDFRPPAKLWVFQSLLLLETFEKMYSTRQLHERAHIHHATTLTLMRRGSSLQGRCALDSPPSVHNDKPGSSSGFSHGSSHSSGAATPDEWWNHWITSEATKRCAFAAFILDSIHATMFGHSAVMVAHEMRLALPCDESLWAATSAAEVGRVEQSLHNAGVRPTTFLEGLKRTLNGLNVRTNSFGRTVIMAGLLSVSWHMNQRDLQINSLGGVAAMLGGRDKWRGALTRAFDLWKVDFDTSLNKVPSASGAYDTEQYYLPDTEDVEHETIFESRTVLHHLAHMAMQVDILDLQIYAGARRLLGRSIGGPDLSSAQRRMKDWAPTARARDATYYALQFLKQVLLPVHGRQYPTPSESGQDVARPDDHLPTAYSARDDLLLNRPWVLYFATLIVWSYGFALDGALASPAQVPSTPEAQYADMRKFLRRVGGVKSPNELSEVKDRNQTLGLLFVLKSQFSEMRWELLKEASNLLNQCTEYLVVS